MWNVPAKSCLRQRVLELADISADRRLQISVQRRGRRAFEFADLRQHLMRGGDVLVRPDFLRRRERAALVLGVGVGVDEDDGERLRAARDQGLRRRRNGRFVDRRADGAISERAFVDLEPQVAIGDREEFSPQSPGLAAVAPAHLQHVAEAAGGDHADARAAPFQQRVGADRGAVHDRAEAFDVSQGLQALQKARRLVAAVRRHFGDAEAARRLVETKQIGEGAADVDADGRLAGIALAHARASRRRRAVSALSTSLSAPRATP